MRPASALLRRVDRWAASALARQAEQAMNVANDLAMRDPEGSRECLLIAAALASEAQRRAESSGQRAAREEVAPIFNRVRRVAEAASSPSGRPFTPHRFRNPR